MVHPTILFIFCIIAVASSQGNGFCNLVWSDEFSGPTVSSDWTKEVACNGGGNNEMQCYTSRDKNVFIDNGALVLKAVREEYTGTQAGCTDNSGCTNHKSYTSGRVNTANSQSWRYGRFETRAKLPSGIQLWPAIWMLPTDWKYGGWAASGEIDIMESRGNDPTHVSGTLHHGGQWPQNVWTTTGDKTLGVDLSDDFHIYTLEWTNVSMKWFLDNTLTQEFNLTRWWNSSAPNVYSAMGQPWDQRFHFILNLAVGGGFFGSDAPVTDAQSAAWKQPELRVDYVRVWQQGGNCAPSQGADNNDRPTTSAPTSSAVTTSSSLPIPSTVAVPSSTLPLPSTSVSLPKCRGQQYDDDRFTCTINDRGQQVLCEIGESSCGNTCFDPNVFCCSTLGNMLPKLFCPRSARPRPTRSIGGTTAL